MNNLLSYYGLVDARMSASEKDLPVTKELMNMSTHLLLDQCNDLLSEGALRVQSLVQFDFGWSGRNFKSVNTLYN